MTATKKALDFTNVTEGGAGRFNRKHQPTGDYVGKITKVEDAPSKKDGEDQWLFTIQVGSGTYPYYCKLTADLLWKVRNLWEAVGIQIPKKRIKVDPTRVVGKSVGVTLEDDDYKDRLRSQVTATFPASEVEGDAAEEEEEEEETEDEEEEEEVAPPKKAKASKKAKAKAAPVEDEDDDELEEIEIEDI